MHVTHVHVLAGPPEYTSEGRCLTEYEEAPHLNSRNQMKIESRFIEVLELKRFRVNLSLPHRLSMSLGKRLCLRLLSHCMTRCMKFLISRNSFSLRHCLHCLGFPGGSVVKNLHAMRMMWVLSLGQEDPLGKEMAICSSILEWEIPWTEAPSRLLSMASQELDTTEQLNNNKRIF